MLSLISCFSRWLGQYDEIQASVGRFRQGGVLNSVFSLADIDELPHNIALVFIITRRWLQCRSKV